MDAPFTAPTSADPPSVFLRYQQELMETVSAETLIAVEKSRRTGYSWAAAAIATLFAAKRRDQGGMNVYYMGYNLEMAREFIGYVAEWAKAIDPAASAVGDYLFPDPDKPDATIQAFRITFASGFKVVALPSVARALRGMQGLVILDEAAFHDDLDEVLKAALALLIWGGKVLVISTHDSEGNPFNALLEEIRGGKRPGKVLRCTFDDALADGLYKRICYVQGKPWSPEAEAAWRAQIVKQYGDAADEELFCIPRKGGGSYFNMLLVEAAASDLIPVLRLTLPPSFAELPEHLRRAEIDDWIGDQLDPVLRTLVARDPSVFGFDFGRHADLSVFWPTQIRPNLSLATPFTLEMRQVPFEQQKQVLWHAIRRLPRFRAGKMDAGGNGAWLAEVTWQKFGAAIEQVKFSADWYRDNMPPLKAAFEERAFSVPLDRETLDDLRLVRTVGGIARVPDLRRKEAGQQVTRHGDAAIAAALAHAASRADPVDYGYQPVASDPTGPRGRDDDDFDDDAVGTAAQIRRSW
ncbi:Protein gp28 [uncultured Alphaproteobacteria bacterium]|uniref:Protein gp28 n=1 Tax=uncultured Alphaproteobacteria bacterium TaxID=91750 RepID=A0A212KN04_9PROT|nr:Protein gp28 [uncultured Alphaproteobacteria bacterium]